MKKGQIYEGTIESVDFPNKGNIYLPHVFTQESETACKVVQMLLEVPEPVRLAPVMEQIRGRLGIQLSPRQYKGVEMVFQHMPMPSISCTSSSR